MADTIAMSGESADGTTDKGRKGSKPKNNKRKSKGGSRNTVGSPEAGMRKMDQTTKPRNEPTFDDLDIAGFNGATPYHRRNRLAITTEGFISLVEKQYNILATKETQFAKKISLSMFVYYCVQHLYVRLVYLRKNDLVEEEFLGYFNSGSFTVPEPIKAYIDGIGFIKDTSGVEYELDFPAWPNRQGDFGRVSAETHYMYGSLPSPRIVAIRVQKDLEYTITPDTQVNWQLPEGIAPVEATAGLPTKNLLGWAPCVALNSNQRALLEELDVTVNDFPSRYGGFKVNADLISRISCALEAINNIETSNVDMTTNIGSQGIISFTDVEPRNYKFVREVQYAELGNVRQVSSQGLDARVSLAGLVMSYRCKKNRFNERDYWCVYDFGEYRNVPQQWSDTANNIFTHGRAGRLNVMEFCTTFLSKEVYREPWLTRQC